MIYENKSKPYIFSWFVELILGIMGKSFNIPFVPLLIFTNCVLPVALFLALFYFLFILTKSHNLSLLGSSFILLSGFPEIITHFINGSYIELRFLSWDVTYTLMFFILCAIFTYKSIVNSKIAYISLAGVFFGSLFYCHPSAWSYIIISYTLFSLYLLFKNRFTQLGTLVFIFLIGLIISVPYWLNLSRLMKLPYFSELLIRVGLFYSHQPELLKLPIIALLLFIFLYRKRDLIFYFISSFLLAAFLSMNQQVISGVNPGAWRWYLYIAKHIALIAGVVLLNNLLIQNSEFLEKIFQGFNYKRVKIFFLGLVFAILMVTGLYSQVYYYEKWRDEQKEKQALYDAFQWLNSHTEVDSVILAPDFASMQLSTYTHNNTYVVSPIFESVMPNAEIIERYFIFARLFGLNSEEVIKYIQKYTSVWFGMRTDVPKYKYYDDSFRLKAISEVVYNDYNYFQKQDLLGLLRRYRIDYIFYNPEEIMLSKIDLNTYPFLSKLYDKSGIQIYKLLNDYK